MILYGILAPTGHNDYVINASCNCLLDNILNDGLVYQGQHLFWLGFGCRQESGSQASGRKDSFTNSHVMILSILGIVLNSEPEPAGLISSTARLKGSGT